MAKSGWRRARALGERAVGQGLARSRIEWVALLGGCLSLACASGSAGSAQVEPALAGAAQAPASPAPAAPPRQPRDPGRYVAFEAGPGRFALAAAAAAAPLVLATEEPSSVQRAAR